MIDAENGLLVQTLIPRVPVSDAPDTVDLVQATQCLILAQKRTPCWM